MKLWASRATGCSGLVVLGVIDDHGEQSPTSPGVMPRSVWVVDEPTAELAAAMLHDAVESATAAGSHPEVDLDRLITRAITATSSQRS